MVKVTDLGPLKGLIKLEPLSVVVHKPAAHSEVLRFQVCPGQFQLDSDLYGLQRGELCPDKKISPPNHSQ